MSNLFKTISLLLLISPLSFNAQLKKFSGKYVFEPVELDQWELDEIDGVATYFYTENERFERIYQGNFHFQGQGFPRMSLWNLQDLVGSTYHEGSTYHYVDLNNNDFVFTGLNYSHYREDTKIEIKGDFNDNLKNGPWELKSSFVNGTSTRAILRMNRNFKDGTLDGNQSVYYNYEVRDREGIDRKEQYLLKTDMDWWGPVGLLEYVDTSINYGKMNTTKYIAYFDSSSNFNGIVLLERNINGVIYREKRNYFHGLLLEQVRQNVNNGEVYGSYLLKDDVPELLPLIQLIDQKNSKNTLQYTAKEIDQSIEALDSIIDNNLIYYPEFHQGYDAFNNGKIEHVTFIDASLITFLPCLFFVTDPLSKGTIYPRSYKYIQDRFIQKKNNSDDYYHEIQDRFQSDFPDKELIAEELVKLITPIYEREEEQIILNEKIELDKKINHDVLLCEQISKLKNTDIITAYTMLDSFLINSQECKEVEAVRLAYAQKLHQDSIIQESKIIDELKMQIQQSIDPYNILMKASELEKSLKFEESRALLIEVIKSNKNYFEYVIPKSSWHKAMQYIIDSLQIDLDTKINFSLKTQSFFFSNTSKSGLIPMKLEKVNFEHISKTFIPFIRLSLDVKVSSTLVDKYFFFYSDCTNKAKLNIEELVETDYKLFYHDKYCNYYVILNTEQMKEKQRLEAINQKLYVSKICQWNNNITEIEALTVIKESLVYSCSDLELVEQRIFNRLVDRIVYDIKVTFKDYEAYGYDKKDLKED